MQIKTNMGIIELVTEGENFNLNVSIEGNTIVEVAGNVKLTDTQSEILHKAIEKAKADTFNEKKEYCMENGYNSIEDVEFVHIATYLDFRAYMCGDEVEIHSSINGGGQDSKETFDYHAEIPIEIENPMEVIRSLMTQVADNKFLAA